ncbi:MAG TPA: hypothetical protein VFM37_14430 [Pseudonocardiaceae bacterium]|nr:hypothetical protein [Pseudonocardiaceae bacterium]
MATGPAHVIVIGRRPDMATQLCFVADARAAAGGRAVTFEPAAGEPVPVLDGVERLDGVLVCASSQSPWERLTRPSAWTGLVRRAGFGLTLPFQAELALRVGRSLAGRKPRPWLVNACFPDAVNPLLAQLGVPVLCGIGNIGLLAASAQAALELPDQRRLRMLAHHLHLHAPAAGEPEALAWLGDEPVDAARLLARQRAVDRTELNHVTGHTAALLLDRLVAGTAAEPLDTHLPGPLGLPGGYPVSLRGIELDLRLPPGVTRAGAIEFNQRAALADGVVVEAGTQAGTQAGAQAGTQAGVQAGTVRFGPAAVAELRALAPELAGGFAVTELPSATARLRALRDRLRGQALDRQSSKTAEQETRV